MAALNDEPGVHLLWITEAGLRRLGSLLVAAAEAVGADEAMSRAGFDWFRGSAEAIERHRDGLTQDGQGLSQAVLTVAKLLLVDDPRDHRQLVRADRVLQRTHLAATVRWLAMQHMNQISERVDRDRILGREPRFASALSALTGGTSGTVVSCFRLGHPEEPGRVTPRRIVAEVLLLPVRCRSPS